MSRRLTEQDVIQRFWEHVDKKDGSGCWIFHSWKDRDGYPSFYQGGYGYKRIRAHRFSYKLFNGFIPKGLEIDHLCHSKDKGCKGGASCTHRSCINPAHLEAVTHQENIDRGRSVTNANAAKTHCPKGHPYSGGNLIIKLKPAYQRQCRECVKEYMHRYRALR